MTMRFIPLLLVLQLAWAQRQEINCGKDDVCLGFALDNAKHAVHMTGQGTVLGTVWKLNGKKAQVFKGIPYAEPPIGEYRFKKPVEKFPWALPRDANTYGPACIQFMQYHLSDRYSEESMARQSEDCLYLNLYGPYNNRTQALYPVIMWVHGGSFLAGSGDTGMHTEIIMQNFAFNEVILITINYRLGIYGFVSSEHKGYRGNYGLMDQIIALRWIQNNIKEFGGDPDRVTVMGESAGGASASILALSPLTEGLIHHAIIMSGSIVANWAVDHKHTVSKWNMHDMTELLTCRRPLNYTQLVEDGHMSPEQVEKSQNHEDCPMIEEAMDCPEDLNEDEMWECFRQKANFSSVDLRRWMSIELHISLIVIDAEIIPNKNFTSFVNDHPRIPIMTGVAEEEWGHKDDPYYITATHHSILRYRNISEAEQRVAIQEIIDKYTHDDETIEPSSRELVGNATYYHYMVLHEPNGPRHWNMPDFISKLREIETDLEFHAPCVREATVYAEQNVPVYLFSFEHVPKNKITESRMAEAETFFGFAPPPEIKLQHVFKKAFHGLDHAYIFTRGYSSNQYFTFDDYDDQMANAFVDMIVKFARAGNPTPTPFKTRQKSITWKPFAKGSPNYLKMKIPDMELVEDQYYWSGSSFWNDLAPQLLRYKRIEPPTTPHPLTADEHLQLAAYKRAWWALWILVAAIAFVLWTAVVCLVARRCMSNRTQHNYTSVMLTEP